MKEDAESKARRRRSLRESFPAPLNQIALRHVDTVHSLDGNRKAILAKALARVGQAHLAACLAAIKSSVNSIKSENDLIAILNLSEIPTDINSTDHSFDGSSGGQAVEEIDTDYMASLLIKCYPDMPQASADALVGSEVMSPSLQSRIGYQACVGGCKIGFCHYCPLYLVRGEAQCNTAGHRKEPRLYQGNATQSSGLETKLILKGTNQQ